MFQTTDGRRARSAGRAAVVIPASALLALAVHGSLGAQAPAARAAYERVAAVVRGHSPFLAAARADLAASVARARAAGRGDAAELSADVEEAPEFRVGEAVFSLTVSREFLVGGRGAAARSVATADVVTAEERLVWWEQAVGAEAELELARWLGWSAVSLRLAAQDSLLAQAEAAIRDRLAGGEARYGDVLRIGAERLRGASDRNLAAAAAGDARARLEALAGAGGGELGPVLDSLVTAGAVPARPPDPPSRDSLLAFAPAVRRAGAELRRLEAERAMVRAETRPRLRASLGAQLAGEGDRRGVGPVAGVAVSLPFTAGSANRAALGAATATIEAAEARLAAVQQRARGVLEAAARRFGAAIARAALFETGLLAAARAERTSALDAYAAGEISLLELLDFERAAFQIEIEGLHALMDATEAWAGLWLGPAEEGDRP
jgi:outer membrane protein TolC